MNFAAVEKIANAVLYEGYILYPYRPSSTKNRQRWNFGTLYPRDFAEAQRPAESYRMSSECLIAGGADAKARCARALPATGAETGFRAGQPPTGKKAWSGRRIRMVCSFPDLVESPASFELRSSSDDAASVQHLTGQLEIEAELVQAGLFKLHLELANLTAIEDAAHSERERMLAFSFTSAHLLLGVTGGEFVSLLDPPEQFRAAAAGCHNKGVFPGAGRGRRPATTCCCARPSFSTTIRK